jgi:putative heme-binding domain-containing protein
MSDDVRAAAQGLLVTRRASAREFLEAIEAGTVDAQAVPREVVERFFLLGDSRIEGLATRLFGPVTNATPAELRSRIDRLAAVLRSGSGVPKPGKQLFDRQCSRCHTLFGKGGKVGPGLTTYRRDDIDTMLQSIVNPNAEIREGFSTSIIATTDGRVLSGVIVEQDKNVVVLRSDEGREINLPRSEIAELRPSPTSLMPQGLLNDLTEQQVRDLFAYLRSSQPLID